MESPLKVAVVILNWNGAELLRKFLPNVIEHSRLKEVEVIVADNASSDNSLEVLETEFSDIRTVILEKNYGFAGGYNKALEQIEATYYLLLNSDVEVSEGWLNPLIKALDEDSNIASVMPKILDYKKKSHFEYAGAAGGFIDKYGYPYCRGRMFYEVEEDKGQYNTPTDVFWVTGCCMLIRSSVYWELGGFDEDFFAHQEEIDLCWRMKNRGYRLQCLPESVVYHVGGASLDMGNPHKTFLNFRNNLFLLYKNLPDADLNRIICCRFILDGIAGLKFLFTDSLKHTMAVVKAHKEFRKMRPVFKQKRLSLQEKKEKERHPEILDSLMMYQFYVKGLKTFVEMMQNKRK